jgi:hypothetical protein
MQRKQSPSFRPKKLREKKANIIRDGREIKKE